ncbi:MAG: hypothetical protein JKY02_03045 [Flavobacteriaceae bacterium]|nr:hypothetical protein [Flavobacteriaceae bacterium]
MSETTKIEQLLPPMELHTCMGLNTCKGHGYSGENDCAGQGDCATVNHPCHVLNECKGQGGCGLFGTTKEFCHPGENDCRFQGSCGTPIMASRFIVQGPNKGTSVWLLARKLFEDRMKTQGKTYGLPPEGQEYGPTSVFAEARGGYESCGQSGPRYCSYAFNAEEKAKQQQARQEKFQTKSADEMSKTMGNCDCD